MRLQTRVLFAAGCVGLLALSIPALSAPAPRGTAHQQRAQHTVQNKRIAQRVATRHKNLRAARAERATRLVSTPIAQPPQRPAFGWPVLVREAREYIGTNPTARTTLWCATFMNLVLAKVGYAGTNSDAAKSFAAYGHRISEPRVGAIAVLTRGRNGGHVGVVSGIDPHGNPIIISGNHGRRVGEGVYPRSRVIAYVMPSERRPASDIQVAVRATPIATNTLSAVSHAPSASGIDSPITELLAAIEAEQNRSEASVRPARPPEPPPAPHRAVQQMPELPPESHRTVEQMPEPPQQFAQQPVQRITRQAAPPARRQLRRDLPLDPALAELFGIKARAQAPQRQQPAQRHDGRVASTRQPVQR
jgi:uncharacterized protein (TIGR02594 family)